MSTVQLILDLHEIGAVKFGNFTLKSGLTSPIYLDLRLLVSYPKLLKQVAEEVWNQVSECSFDLLCGVPYTALPIATVMSVTRQVPMVMRRKEAKEYGTKKIIEGAFQEGDRCLVVEDLVTSGKSVIETIQPLEKENIQVKDIVVLIDREQGGKELLAERGYTLHSVFTLTQILDILSTEERLDLTTVDSVKQFLTETQLANL